MNVKRVNNKYKNGRICQTGLATRSTAADCCYCRPDDERKREPNGPRARDG